MDNNVQLAVCFLCTDFCNTIIWESWRSDDDEKSEESSIGFVSHPRPENKHSVPYSVDSLEKTQWGDNSLVRAEIRLLSSALERFPKALQFLIVSGDTVPIRPKEEFMEFYIYSDPNVSSVTLEQDVRPVNRDDLKKMKEIGIDTLYNGHQFIALSRSHAEYLISPTVKTRLARMNDIAYETPRMTENFAPDEVHIHTVLANAFPVEQFYNNRFVEFVAEGRHAKNLKLGEFKDLYTHCMESDTLLCIRKVSKQAQWEIYSFLSEQGVVNGISGVVGSVDPPLN